jgi:hypothetical protein
MATEHILALLTAERDKLSKAIEALTGPIKRRGRPPKNTTTIAASEVAPSNAPAEAPKKRARTFSAAQRKAAGDRMRARWAIKKKAAAKAAKAKRTAPAS